MASISRQVLHIMLRNYFRKHKAYPGAAGHHFKNVIWKNVHWIAG